MIKILDLYDLFFNSFDIEKLNSDYFIEHWKNVYSNYDEIVNRCLEDRKNDDIELPEIVDKYILNSFKEKFSMFEKTINNIRDIINKTIDKINKKFIIEEDIYIIFYIGLANGAGWVSEYNNKQAIYFGLEQIVSLDWYEPKALESLIIHELGHVYHFYLRKNNNLPLNYDNNQSDYLIWRLYEEGFAERFKQHITNNSRYDSNKELEMEKNIAKLVNLYSDYIDKGKKEYDFFGDWYNIDGMSMTGYYMGPKLIELIEKDYDINEIAIFNFNEIKKSVYYYIYYNCIGAYDKYTSLSTHSKYWSEIFLVLKDFIMKKTSSNISKIEHIGSTSVPNMIAKPIIDIMITYENNENKINIVNDFKDLGFEYLGENGLDNREFFKVKRDDKVIAHVHVVPDNSNYLENHLIFKNKMINDKNIFDEYIKLKLNLSKKYVEDRAKYTESKADFIKNVLNV